MQDIHITISEMQLKFLIRQNFHIGCLYIILHLACVLLLSGSRAFSN